MYTVESQFNEPLFNEVLDITNDMLCPGQSYSKMYGIEPRYNKPRYNEFFATMNIIWKPKCKIYLDTNYNELQCFLVYIDNFLYNLYFATFLNRYSESVAIL